ncbi:hypothetical protein BMI85_15790 [Thioclava sp. DLFJ4-1]|nr:hypothetical protein BMI89_19940 [Thioclava sp. F36-7]OOY15013.1 hypothetical protein BMI85_15790 [Thioclava sp. DLFJ4-1]
MNPITIRKLGTRNKTLRALWGFARLLLFAPSPRTAHRWRRMLLRVFGAHIERGCLIYPSARIWAPWNLEMATGSVIGDGAEIYNVATVRLCRGTVISQRAFLCTASHDYSQEEFNLVAGEIRLNEGAWVAAEAFVGPGVEIGAFAILGARAVATRDISANVIAGGIPARSLSHRPSVTTPPGIILSGLSHTS